MSAKIFVRERTRVKDGAKKPRFAIVAVSGLELQIVSQHVRKQELEEIASHLEAEVIYLKVDEEKKQK